MSKFVDVLLEAARGWLGHMEVTRNSSPEIDQWLAYAHAHPGDPWCPAYVCAMHREAAVHLDVPNPCPRTDSVHTMYERALSSIELMLPVPVPGCVYFLDHGHRTGHCGIVTLVSPSGTVLAEISGNTNAAGSREGNTIAEHHGRPELTHGGKILGYALFAPDDPPALLGIDSLPQSPFA